MKPAYCFGGFERSLLVAPRPSQDTLIRIGVAGRAYRGIPHVSFDTGRWFWEWASRTSVDYVDADGGIYTVNVDGSGRRRLTPDSGGGGGAARGRDVTAGPDRYRE